MLEKAYQILKEEKCTMDDIGAYLDYLNTTYFYKNMSCQRREKDFTQFCKDYEAYE